jgi:hypothetical protein
MSEGYAVDRTGLLIVDPYNDFMSEGGKLYDAIKPTADASACSATAQADPGSSGASALPTPTSTSR